MTHTAGWRILDEAEVFTAPPYIRVLRQKIVTESGQSVPDYYQIVMPEFTVGCPIAADGRIVTLWGYKHGCRASGLMFPAGRIDPGETPEAAIRRELLEETGFSAATCRALGRYAVSGNQGCGWAHLFVLDGCRQVGLPDPGDLERMEVRLMAPADIDRDVRAGEVHIISQLAMWSMARWTGAV